MFVCFMLQIVFRYVLNQPLGWTEEVIVLCWVWVVLWGAAFILRERDEIRFDIIYSACQRADARASSPSITGIALDRAVRASRCPRRTSYVIFMKVEHSAYLRIRLDCLYSIYVDLRGRLHRAATRWLAWRAIRGQLARRPSSADGVER